MIDQKNRYIIDNYGKKSVFANFLPSISGVHGTPLWCFYVNRGQAISSFGVRDKDHSIMQFYPAGQAYTLTKKMGFRTFLKIDGEVSELFSKEDNHHFMAIGMNELEIQEDDHKLGIRSSIQYGTLPGESFGGLIRKVTLENIDDQVKNIEVLDGMAAILPYGVDLGLMNEIGQTVRAWMQVQDYKSGVPIFKVRASIKDTAQVTEVVGGNYGMGMTEDGTKLEVIISPETLFGYDTSLEKPVEFYEKRALDLCEEHQKTENLLPCCFFAGHTTLHPGECYTFYEMYGQAEDLDQVKNLRKTIKDGSYFERKFENNRDLVDSLTDKIGTKTVNPIFDRYCRQTYLDNVLRGGEPIKLGKNHVFYVYSRKHGDIERDYNYFTILPEYYSQGNGNFRDVNQNRRVDVKFSPYVFDRNIKMFYQAIQLDGYNPLGIEKTTCKISAQTCEKFKLQDPLYQEECTPGALYTKLAEQGFEANFYEILDEAEFISKTDFKEGYWSDHWTYNLDLVEEFLAIYPDHEEELLFFDRAYTYRVPKEIILPRDRRCVKTEHGLRQYRFLEKNEAYKEDAYICDTRGNVIYHSLINKLLLLCVVKYAALDPYGMGVEMEGGKPGWYDALNGLPGLFGSSMAETYELLRMIEFVTNILSKYEKQMDVPIELYELWKGLVDDSVMFIADQKVDSHQAKIAFWKSRGKKLEQYRKQIHKDLSGNTVEMESLAAKNHLNLMQEIIREGIREAKENTPDGEKGMIPTYFYYTVLDYKEDVFLGESTYEIFDVKQNTVPLFLEGSVRYLKQKDTKENKRNLYQKIKKSDLYDSDLHMYKVNSGLSKASYEIGRAKAFTPGWLENESIWMHMEYKYLLELLKSGLYEEFFEDFRWACVPFMNESEYGRSLLENSSFIASTANPDPKIHGKGFVARLSGSTAEFIHMWQIMMFGENPFEYNDSIFSLAFKPSIPAYLIGNQEHIQATFLGTVSVDYCLTDTESIFGENYRISKYELHYEKEICPVFGDRIFGQQALDVRNGNVHKIKVYIERK